MPYVINDDGTASPVEWGPEVDRWANTGERHLFITVVGCVHHGGVKASAIHITRHETYNAKTWLETGELVHAREAFYIEREGA